MKIIVTREGVEKNRENTGKKFDERPAIKFLSGIFESQLNEGGELNAK